MSGAWKQFSGDFNSATDEEIEQITKREEDALDRAEAWIEAVASWKAAGRPRRPINLHRGV